MDKMPEKIYVLGGGWKQKEYFVAHIDIKQIYSPTEYRREDLPKEVDLGVVKLDKMILSCDMQFHYKQGWNDCLDHLVALGVIKDTGE